MTFYYSTQADRQYNRNTRFARQFREFATGRTPRSPLQVQVDRQNGGEGGIHEKLLAVGAHEILMHI